MDICQGICTVEHFFSWFLHKEHKFAHHLTPFTRENLEAYYWSHIQKWKTNTQSQINTTLAFPRSVQLKLNLKMSPLPSIPRGSVFSIKSQTGYFCPQVPLDEFSCQTQLHFWRQKILALETHMISLNRVFPSLIYIRPAVTAHQGTVFTVLLEKRGADLGAAQVSSATHLL